jgi:hypothetical protein
MSITTTRPVGLLSQLRTEWDARFADRCITLTGTEISCRELAARLRSVTGAEQDRLLHELLELAQTGDHTAVRVLLHHMQPKAVHFARTCAALRDLNGPDRTSADAVSTAIGAMWEAIANYPLKLREKVQANLGLNALNIITKIHAATETPMEGEVIERVADTSAAHTLEPDWGDDSFHDLVTVLRWALDTHTLSPDEVRLLASFDLGEQADRARIADELGIARDSANRRVHRIRVKLVAAVQEHIRVHGSW